MGNTSSLLPKNGESLYQSIKKEINNIIHEYKFWTDRRICDKITFVYQNKLIQFKKEDLLDASMSIGIKQDKEVDKVTICNKIIKHYRARIELLQRVWESVNKLYKKIYLSKNGPVCQSVDKFIDNFFTCKEYNGIWIDEEQYQSALSNMNKHNLNKDQKFYIKNLNTLWINSMKKLHKYIIIIKNDINNSIDDESFDQLKESILSIIKKMNYLSDIYYLLIIN